MDREKATIITDISQLPDLPWDEYNNVDEATRRTAKWWYEEIHKGAPSGVWPRFPTKLWNTRNLPTNTQKLIGDHPVHSLTLIEQYLFHNDADFSLIDPHVSAMWNELDKIGVQSEDTPSHHTDSMLRMAYGTGLSNLLPANSGSFPANSGSFPDRDKLSLFYEPYSHDGPISEWHNSANVVVDLDAPDKVIIESFGKWLIQVRKTALDRGRKADLPPKIFSKAEFDKWYENRILLLRYLQQWAFKNNKHIPQRILGEVLFSDDYGRDRTELIRKTVKPMAKTVFSQTTLFALRLQASTEQAETS